MVAEETLCEKPASGHLTSPQVSRLSHIACAVNTANLADAGESPESPTSPDSFEFHNCEECQQGASEVWCKNCYSSLCSSCDPRVHALKKHHVRIPFSSNGLGGPWSPQSVLSAGPVLGATPCLVPRLASPRLLSVTASQGSQAEYHEDDLFWVRGGGGSKGGFGSGGKAARPSTGALVAAASFMGKETFTQNVVVGSFTEEDIFEQGYTAQGKKESKNDEGKSEDVKEETCVKERESISSEVSTATRHACQRDVEGGSFVRITSRLPSQGGKQTEPGKAPVSPRPPQTQPQRACPVFPPSSSLWLLPEKEPSKTVAQMSKASREAEEVGREVVIDDSSTSLECSWKGGALSLPRSLSIPIAGHVRVKKEYATDGDSSESSEEHLASSTNSPASPAKFILRSSSCPAGRASAIRGSRPRPPGLHVQWAPDVRDPLPSSASHTLGSPSSMARSGSSARRNAMSARGRRRESKRAGESGRGKRGGRGSSHGKKNLATPAEAHKVSDEEEAAACSPHLTTTESKERGKVQEDAILGVGMEEAHLTSSLKPNNEAGGTVVGMSGMAQAGGVGAGTSTTETDQGWSLVGRRGKRSEGKLKHEMEDSPPATPENTLGTNDEYCGLSPQTNRVSLLEDRLPRLSLPTSLLPCECR